VLMEGQEDPGEGAAVAGEEALEGWDRPAERAGAAAPMGGTAPMVRPGRAEALR